MTSYQRNVNVSTHIPLTKLGSAWQLLPSLTLFLVSDLILKTHESSTSGIQTWLLQEFVLDTQFSPVRKNA